MAAPADDGKVTPSEMRMAMLRLASDLRAIQADPPSGCSASPATEDNLFLWNATIIGPDESPWEGAGATMRHIAGRVRLIVMPSHGPAAVRSCAPRRRDGNLRPTLCDPLTP